LIGWWLGRRLLKW